MGWLTRTWRYMVEETAGVFGKGAKNAVKEMYRRKDERKAQRNKKANANAEAIQGNKTNFSKAKMEMLNSVNLKKIDSSTQLVLTNLNSTLITEKVNQKQVNTSKEFKDTFLGGLMNDVLQGAKEGLTSGVKQGINNGVDKMTGQIINTKGVQDSSDYIGEYGGKVIQKSIKNFFKDNWIYILFPLLGLFVFAKYMFKKK